MDWIRFTDNCPYGASGTLPLQYGGWTVDRAWGGGEGIRSGTLGFWGVGGHRLLLLHSSFPVAPPWEPQPVQVTVFGFIFCWARLSPGRGGGREKRRGEGTALSAQSRCLCSCPPWPGCHPLPEGLVPGHNGDPDPRGASSCGAASRLGIGFFSLTLSPFILLQSL